MSSQFVEITEADLPQNLKVLWLKALSAEELQNYSYAISLANAVLKEEPGFLKGRRLARKCAAKMTAGQKKKVSALTGLLSGGVNTMKLSNAAKKDPAAALILIEKELEKNPYDAGVNEVLFETALMMGMSETAAFALETVREGAPENTKMLHKLAEYYVGIDRPDLATEVYNDIVKQAPGDINAVKGAKDCSAKASMKKQRWGEGASMDELKKDAAGAKKLEEADRAAMTRDQMKEKLAGLIGQYEQDQNDLNVVKQIAKLYEDLEKWESAHAFYDWAFQISNGDAALRKKSEQLGDRVAKEKLAALEAQLETDPNNEELRAQLDEARKAHAMSTVAEASKRVEQNPTDPQLRFELGSALYNAGNYSDAIPHLQQATRNPHIRTKVLLTLARAFDGKGMHDLAIKQLADALADLQGMDDTKKEVLYEKGLIHSKMGVKEDALACFKEIYEVDYGYRDVAQRVESSYS
ncbi:tetratricopeptide repeat protein [Rubritalea spongiae]|uniref:Tetratricopeptide repeat protein n=1 Tax=Rubritalea spongiae TaxID=430797 RepID=A0ABW5E5I9_9BACT